MLGRLLHLVLDVFLDVIDHEDVFDLVCIRSSRLLHDVDSALLFLLLGDLGDFPEHDAFLLVLLGLLPVEDVQVVGLDDSRVEHVLLITFFFLFDIG